MPDIPQEQVIRSYTTIMSNIEMQEISGGVNWKEEICNPQQLLANIFVSKTLLTQIQDEQRNILDMEKIILLHYMQQASGIKKLLKQENSATHSKEIDDFIDEKFNNYYAETLSATTRNIVKNAFDKSLDNSSKINIEKLNKTLNEEAKKNKKVFDSMFKEGFLDKVHEKYPDVDLYDGNLAKILEETTTFGIPAKVNIKDSEVTVDMSFGTTTSHTKGKQSTVPISMKKNDSVIFEGVRTTIVGVINDTEETTKRIAAMTKNVAGPTIYNLFTSVHSRGFFGFLDRRFDSGDQTAKLLATIAAQKAHNKLCLENKDFNTMFFTIVTPYNGFGHEDISLKNKNKEIREVAESNIISLAISLFEKDDKNVQAMIRAHIENKQDDFNNAYSTLQKVAQDTITTITEGAAKNNKQVTKKEGARLFLLHRFKDNTEAAHKYAKATAVYLGVITATKNIKLFFGCKSGNERTFHYLARIRSFFEAKEEPYDIKLFTAEQENETFLHSTYKKCLLDPISLMISLVDQGSIPKTGNRSNVLHSINTNYIETLYPSLITSGFKKYQAHKNTAYRRQRSWPEFIICLATFGIINKASNFLPTSRRQRSWPECILCYSTGGLMCKASNFAQSPSNIQKSNRYDTVSQQDLFNSEYLNEHRLSIVEKKSPMPSSYDANNLKNSEVPPREKHRQSLL